MGMGVNRVWGNKLKIFFKGLRYVGYRSCSRTRRGADGGGYPQEIHIRVYPSCGQVVDNWAAIDRYSTHKGRCVCCNTPA